MYLTKYQSKKYWYPDTRHSQAEAKMFKTIETYLKWNTFDSAFGSCFMQLLHVNTNLFTISLDFSSQCPNKLNAAWYNTHLQKPLSFYKRGHRSMNRYIIIFNLSFFTHSHYFWSKTEFSISPANTCPVRASNVTLSLAVLVTKRNSLVLFHFSFITEASLSREKKAFSAIWVQQPACSFAYMQTEVLSRVLRKKWGRLIIMLPGFPDSSNSNTPRFVFFSLFSLTCIYCSVNSTILRSCPAYQAKY